MTSYRPRFAWLPTRMTTDGQWIWLRTYQSINNGKQKRLYEPLPSPILRGRDQDRSDVMPDEIVAWPAFVTPSGKTALAGTWGVSRYHPEAEAYTRDDIAWNKALEAAVKQLEKRIEDIVTDEGFHDYTTNVTELPEWAEDICGELETQAAAIRAMKREPK